MLIKNIFCTFTTELPDVQTLKLLGEKNLMFESDFPHNESFFSKYKLFLMKIKINIRTTINL